MLNVGLTGNIASGKSTVAARFADLGAVVLDSDGFARDAVAPGTPALERVFTRFGDAVRAPDGTLDRKALGNIVFRDVAARRDLERIVHPEVARRRAAGIAAAAANGARVVVCDVPLLFEAGLRDDFDVVVVVDAAAPIRLERLMRARGIAERSAREMMDAQMDQEIKRADADAVIRNDGSLDELRAAVDAVWRDLTRRTR